jgi:hypothetical protein
MTHVPHVIAVAEMSYEGRLRLHPNRVNLGALWGAAITLFPTGLIAPSAPLENDEGDEQDRNK